MSGRAGERRIQPRTGESRVRHASFISYFKLCVFVGCTCVHGYRCTYMSLHIKARDQPQVPLLRSQLVAVAVVIIIIVII